MLPNEAHSLRLLLCTHFQVEYPEIEEDSQPRHRFMSSFEQRKEATDRKYQVIARPAHVAMAMPCAFPLVKT